MIDRLRSWGGLAPLLLGLGVALLVTGLSPGPARAKSFARETPVVQAVRLAGPAVVNISTRQVVNAPQRPFNHFGDDFFNWFFRDFFEPFEQRSYSYTSLGSGVIIDGRKGFILTNEHVVAGANQIKVVLSDEREFEATLIGSDPDSDLAVLQIKTRQPLPALAMGDSSDLMIGETVIAIGNPFGLNHTVTTGVVSAVNRSIRTKERIFRDFIQTDASINPGNSGGPLLNINAELIGINTAIYDRAEGIGFATPINKARRIIQDLISYGEVQSAWLGLMLQSLDARLAQYFKAPKQSGAVVTEVDPQGPAARSGLTRGDVLVGLDHNRISSLDDYEDLLKTYTSGDLIKLKFYRQGREYEVRVKAGQFPREKALQLSWSRYGLRVSDNKKGSGAVVITKVKAGSPAHHVGLARGDLIHRINEVETDSVDKYVKAMSRYRLRLGVSAVVQRGSSAYHVTLAP